ncbi:enabled [Angomonas deanei]|uniref:Uncharacterized protein n=1 Tax=Angomonas deanei TaxID=59799 RepID=A0A7G2CF33_9TRYP|nr:enabled [Angomonas deanei]CAD2218430.1 hypothetical protein, conserved [Angomonas deanei]|eukprot:EPY22094.1 enabled [Angomonas deanei]
MFNHLSCKYHHHRRHDESSDEDDNDNNKKNKFIVPNITIHCGTGGGVQVSPTANHNDDLSHRLFLDHNTTSNNNNPANNFLSGIGQLNSNNNNDFFAQTVNTSIPLPDVNNNNNLFNPPPPPATTTTNDGTFASILRNYNPNSSPSPPLGGGVIPLPSVDPLLNTYNGTNNTNLGTLPPVPAVDQTNVYGANNNSFVPPPPPTSFVPPPPPVSFVPPPPPVVNLPTPPATTTSGTTGTYTYKDILNRRKRKKSKDSTGGNDTSAPNENDDNNNNNGSRRASRSQLARQVTLEREKLLLDRANKYVQSLEEELEQRGTHLNVTHHQLAEEEGRAVALRQDREMLLKLNTKLEKQRNDLERKVSKEKKRMQRRMRMGEERSQDRSGAVDTSSSSSDSSSTSSSSEDGPHPDPTANTDVNLSILPPEVRAAYRSGETLGANTNLVPPPPPPYPTTPLPPSPHSYTEVRMSGEGLPPPPYTSVSTPDVNVSQEERGRQELLRHLFLSREAEYRRRQELEKEREALLLAAQRRASTSAAPPPPPPPPNSNGTNHISPQASRLSYLENYVDTLWREAQTGSQRLSSAGGTPTPPTYNYTPNSNNNNVGAAPPLDNPRPPYTTTPSYTNNNISNSNPSGNYASPNLHYMSTPPPAPAPAPVPTQNNQYNDLARDRNYLYEVDKLRRDVAVEGDKLRRESQRWHGQLMSLGNGV